MFVRFCCIAILASGLASPGCARFRKKGERPASVLSSLAHGRPPCGLEGTIDERVAACKTKVVEWELVTHEGRSHFQVWRAPMPEAGGDPHKFRYWTSTWGRVMPQEEALHVCEMLVHPALPGERLWRLPTQAEWKDGIQRGVLRLGAETEEARPSWNWYWTASNAPEPELEGSEFEAFAVHRKKGTFSRKINAVWNLGLVRCFSGLPILPEASAEPSSP